MDDTDLRIFLRLAKTLHFGEAAMAENIAQSALSARIKSLEERLGARLFDRSTRAVTLTPAGRAFLGEARELAARIKRSEQVVRRAAESGYAPIRVGGIDSALAGRIAGIVRLVRTTGECYEVLLHEMLTHVAEQALIGRRIDVAFTRTPSADPDTESLFLAREGMQVAVPVDHPLADQELLSAETVAQEVFVLQSRAQRPILFDNIQDYFAARDLTIDICQEANERHMLLALVAAGLGVSLVPDWVTSFHRENVVYRPLEDGGPSLDIYMVWRREDPLAPVQAFVEAVRERFS